MRIYAVDDERLMLNALSKAISAAVPDAEVSAFRTSAEVLRAQAEAPCDVVFLDICMPGRDGVDIARRITESSSATNVVFVTGHDKYKADAMDVYASDYILKPVTKERVEKAMANLRHPVKPRAARCRAITFGNFALYVDGVPVTFHRRKSAELFAYLVDRGGTTVSRAELTYVLFESETHSVASRKKLDNALSTLTRDLKDVGASEVLCRKSDGLAINRELVSADCYDYLEHGTPQYCGLYMEQYSWGEYFKASQQNAQLRSIL